MIEQVPARDLEVAGDILESWMVGSNSAHFHRRGAVSIMMPTPVPISAPDTGWPVATPTPVPMSPPAIVAHPVSPAKDMTAANSLILESIISS
jgi:hypothetical protein